MGVSSASVLKTRPTTRTLTRASLAALPSVSTTTFIVSA